MKYLKYTIAYLGLLIMIAIIGLLIMNFNHDIKLSLGDKTILIFILFPLVSYIYDKYKPFKLTGDLDLKIKRFFNSYFESQKSCPNCDKVVKASELTPDGKCLYCKEEKNIK